MKVAPTLAATLVLVACSSSSPLPTTETAQDAGLQNSNASLLRSIAEALCPLYERCSWGHFAKEYGSLEECITEVSSAPPVEIRLVGLAPNFGEQLLDAVKRATCAPADGYYDSVDIRLDSAAPGSLPVGASCWHSYQCASGTCSPVGDCGRECINFVWPSCSKDSDCDFEYCSPAGKCGLPPPKELGAACMYNPDCLSNYCEFDSAADAGVCAVYASDMGLGESCVGGSCAAGLECSKATMTCVMLAYDPIGSACDRTDSTRACLGGYCSRLTAQCTAHAKPGGACTIQGDPECPRDHTCVVTEDGGVSGTCQPTALVEVCH